MAGVDVDAAVAAAVEAVQRPAPLPVSDWDVLSALMERREVAQAAIMAALAVEPLPQPPAGDMLPADALTADAQ